MCITVPRMCPLSRCLPHTLLWFCARRLHTRFALHCVQHHWYVGRRRISLGLRFVRFCSCFVLSVIVHEGSGENHNVGTWSAEKLAQEEFARAERQVAYEQ